MTTYAHLLLFVLGRYSYFVLFFIPFLFLPTFSVDRSQYDPVGTNKHSIDNSNSDERIKTRNDLRNEASIQTFKGHLCRDLLAEKTLKNWT